MTSDLLFPFYLGPVFHLGFRVANRNRISTHFLSVSLLVRAKGVPEECPLWPVKRGLSLFPMLCKRTRPRYLPRLAELLHLSRLYAKR